MFAPGSRYEYSNTDNIVVGLIARGGHRAALRRVLHEDRLRPGEAAPDVIPDDASRCRALHPRLRHGPGETPEDVSDAVQPERRLGVRRDRLDPADLNAFIRAYLGLRFFDAAQQREQMRFVPGGESSPPGPGRNSAGLARLPLRTRCGTVYGHTGNFPGYVQFAAATRRRQTGGHDLAQHPGTDGAALDPAATGADDGGLRSAPLRREMTLRAACLSALHVGPTADAARDELLDRALSTLDRRRPDAPPRGYHSEPCPERSRTSCRGSQGGSADDTGGHPIRTEGDREPAQTCSMTAPTSMLEFVTAPLSAPT